jgi:ankyrin repeat protein
MRCEYCQCHPLQHFGMNNNDSVINAIKSNNISLVASLIAGGSINVNARIDKQNSSALHLAAQLGHVEIVALLLDAGAHIDDVNDYHDTACHAAVRECRIDVVKQLVSRNANLSLQNGVEGTPITMAIYKKNEALVMLLVDAAIAAGIALDDATLCLAATIGTDVIQLLLFKHRVDLTAIRGISGRTPLHLAVWHMRDSKVLDMLVGAARIDIDARDEIGCTAAHIASATCDAGALARLVAAGANLELADDNGDTPLLYSRFDASDQIAVMLLAAGVNANAKNNRGSTLCHLIYTTSLVSLPALLAFGANLDEPNNDGVTPRQLLKTLPPTTEEIALARKRVHSAQLLFVRQRAFEISVALHSLDLDALCMCEILRHSCGPVARFVPFHMWWQLATKVKHWKQIQ